MDLELFIKVVPGWRSHPGRLAELGYRGDWVAGGVLSAAVAPAPPGVAVGLSQA